MVEQLSNSVGNFERDGLPIRVFDPELDRDIDAKARLIADIGEKGIDEALDFRGGLMKEAYRYRLLALRTGNQDFTQLADSYQFLYDVAWEAIERAKEILVAEGRDRGTQLRKLKEEPEQRTADTSQNQGI